MHNVDPRSHRKKTEIYSSKDKNFGIHSAKRCRFGSRARLGPFSISPKRTIGSPNDHRFEVKTRRTMNDELLLDFQLGTIYQLYQTFSLDGHSYFNFHL
jgi:hypothetical protein